MTLTYKGESGTFRLDYWPPGNWEELRTPFGRGFLWSKCSEQRVTPLTSGNSSFLKDFEPSAPAILPPQPANSLPNEPPDPFPNGCPTRDFDRFMAEIRLPGVTVTVNAPYGLCCQTGDSFCPFDDEAALEVIARSLRARQTVSELPI